jgi:hypothetical protein
MTRTSDGGEAEVTGSLADLSPTDPGSEPLERPSRLAVLIEPMTEEQTALLAEDLVGILTGQARGQDPEVASEQP